MFTREVFTRGDYQLDNENGHLHYNLSPQVEEIRTKKHIEQLDENIHCN